MGNLLFSPSGRINGSEFMKGAIVVIIISAILNILPMFSYKMGSMLSMLSILLLWPIIALAIKRAHDADKSGWMCLIPIIAMFILTLIASTIVQKVFGGDAYTDLQAATQAAAESGDFKEIMSVASEHGAKLTKKVTLPNTIAGAVIMYIVAFGYNSMMKHDPEENRFGPAN